MSKLKVHLILPGGGVRGSFQGGFIYVLTKFFRECFDFVQIDSASAGALNGTGLCLEMDDDLKKFWLNFNSINDIFTPYSSIPLIGTLINAYSSYYRMGLNTNEKLEKIIHDFFAKCDEEHLENVLGKINVVVTDLTSSRYKYVNGTDKNFKEYLKASASPWILTQPTVVGGIHYTDGSLLQQFPLKNLKTVDCDLTMIVGVDSEYLKYMYSDIGNNLFGYINKVLDVLYLQCNLKDYVKIMELEDRDKDVYVSKYNLDFSPMDFSQENINEGLKQGKREALLFVLNNINLKDFYEVSEYLDVCCSCCKKK